MGTSIYVKSGMELMDGPDKSAPAPENDQQPEKPAINIPPPRNTPRARSSVRKPEPPAASTKDDVKVTGTLTQVVNRINELSSGGGTHAPIEHVHPCAESINANCSNPDFQVIAIAPHSENGHSPIPCPPMMKVQDIRQWLRSKFGNGTYILKTMRDGVELNGESSYMRMMIMDAVGTVAPTLDEDPVKAAKTRATVKKVELEERKTEAELNRIKDEEEKARKKREKEEKAEENAPANAVIETLKKQLEDQNKKLEELTKQPKSSMTDELVKLAPLLSVLVPLLKPKEENTTKLILDLFAKMDEREDKREERAERRDEKREEKFEKLIEKIEESKKDKGTIHEKLEEYEMMAKIFGRDRDDDDFDIDPDRPIASAFAALIKVGAKGFAALAKDPATRQVMAHVAARLGKTPETLGETDMTAVTDELTAMQRYIAENPPQSKLPPPPPAPTPIQLPKLVPLAPPVNLHGQSISGLKVQPNPSQPVTETAVDRDNGETSLFDSKAADTPPLSQESTSAAGNSGDNLTPSPVTPAAQSETPKPTAETGPTELFEEPALSQADIENDIRDSVSNTTKTMVLDILNKRWDACKWWDSMSEWPRELVDRFCAPCPDFISGKKEILKQYADAKIYAKLEELLSNQSNAMEFNGTVMRFCTYRNTPEVVEGA